MSLITAKASERTKGMESQLFTEIAEVRTIARGVSDVIDLGYGEPDFDTPVHIREAAKRALDDGYTHYVLPVTGFDDLRRAISNKLSRENGITADPETEIIVTSGVQEAINVAMLALVDQGDEVILCDPGYDPYPKGIMIAGGVPVWSRLREENDFYMDLEDIKAKITPKTKAIVLISPNMPIGWVPSKPDLEELAGIARERDIFIITDEIYEKLIYDGKRHISIASLPDMKERTISLFGFSKAYAMCGWRVGYMTADRSLSRMLAEIHVQLVIGTSAVAQKAALAALTGPQDCVEQMRVEYERRRDALVEGLTGLGIRCVPPKAAIYLLANISELGISGFELAKMLAREARVIVHPGSAYSMDKSAENYIRFSLTRPVEKIEKAIDRMEGIVQRLRRVGA